MKTIEQSKDKYDNIPIPKELGAVVQDAIRQSEANRKNGKYPVIKGKQKIYKWGVGIAAALLAGLTIGVNTSETFAMEMQKIPVIGELVKILTIRSFTQETENIKIVVEVPGVELGDDTYHFSEEVNEEISSMCYSYAKEAQIRAEEYREAFLETGGTEEEWAEHNIEIKVWYTVESQTEDYLSFSVHGTESWTSAYAETKFYNLDVKNLKYITLQDLLGSDSIKVANESIKSQMQVMEEELSVEFWSDEQAFQSIQEDTRFYINQTGNPVIVFEKYEIAPGSMGELEFEIKK